MFSDISSAHTAVPELLKAGQNFDKRVFKLDVGVRHLHFLARILVKSFCAYFRDGFVALHLQFFALSRFKNRINLNSTNYRFRECTRLRP